MNDLFVKLPRPLVISEYATSITDAQTQAQAHSPKEDISKRVLTGRAPSERSRQIQTFVGSMWALVILCHMFHVVVVQWYVSYDASRF